MVDFRYHLVSIVAVFLALATGIAIGATALNGGLVHNLNGQIRRLISEKDQLRSEYQNVRREADDGSSFMKAITPGLVTSAAKGKRVVVVSLPNADKVSRDQALATLGTAGATITAQIRVSEKAIDPQSSALIDDLASRLVPATVVLPSGEAAGRLATVLGTVLARRGVPTASEQADITRVVTGLREAGMIEVDGKATVGGGAVVVAALPQPQANSTRDVFSLALTRSLDASGEGTVVVGPVAASQSGGTIGAVRADARTALVVSTVDDMDRPMGALTLIRALLEQLKGGVGQYGTGVGATAIIATAAR